VVGCRLRLRAETDAQGYYNCMASFASASSCGWDGTFDAAALSAAITDEIIEPRRETQEMLARHTHLTRLYTTMDPSEMSLDPLSRIDEGLPAVSSVHTATVVHECTQEYVLGDAPQRSRSPTAARSDSTKDGPSPAQASGASRAGCCRRALRAAVVEAADRRAAVAARSRAVRRRRTPRSRS
jgi:hypothetical protein